MRGERPLLRTKHRMGNPHWLLTRREFARSSYISHVVLFIGWMEAIAGAGRSQPSLCNHKKRRTEFAVGGSATRGICIICILLNNPVLKLYRSAEQTHYPRGWTDGSTRIGRIPPSLQPTLLLPRMTATTPWTTSAARAPPGVVAGA